LGWVWCWCCGRSPLDLSVTLMFLNGKICPGTSIKRDLCHKLLKKLCDCQESLKLCGHLLRNTIAYIITFSPPTGYKAHDYGPKYPYPLNRPHYCHKSTQSSSLVSATFGYPYHDLKIHTVQFHYWIHDKDYLLFLSPHNI
jgi:hypothetical protein